MAAISMGMVGPIGSSSASASSSSSSWLLGRSRIPRGRKGCGGGGGVRCAAVAGSLADQYRTLRIQPGASELEVKKAFRQLALQYHPDVCKGRDYGVQFHRINEAYDIVMSNLRAGEAEQQESWPLEEWGTAAGYDDGESTRGMCDQTWELWEEWMGWEGAGIRDYTAHINPYI